jgi:hypothetical protein
LNAIITEPDICSCLEGVVVVRFNVKSVTFAVVSVLLGIRLRPYSTFPVPALCAVSVFTVGLGLVPGLR